MSKGNSPTVRVTTPRNSTEQNIIDAFDPGFAFASLPQMRKPTYTPHHRRTVDPSALERPNRLGIIAY